MERAFLPVDMFAGRRALFGIRQAVDRFRRAIEAQLGDGAYCAAIEACAWATVLDDRHTTDPGYVPARDADEDGRVLVGLRWVRHRGVHEAINVFEWPDHLDVCWLDRAKVRGEHHRKVDLEVIYDAHLAGRPVLETLQAASQWFDPPLQ